MSLSSSSVRDVISLKTPLTSMPGARARTWRVTAPMSRLALGSSGTVRMILPEDTETGVASIPRSWAAASVQGASMVSR